jgi:ABC transporter substrate binding protein
MAVEGGLISYAMATSPQLPDILGESRGDRLGGTSAIDLYRRAASYVDRILRGAKVSELPVQQPTKFEMVINLRAAKANGLTNPETLLATADEVIQ